MGSATHVPVPPLVELVVVDVVDVVLVEPVVEVLPVLVVVVPPDEEPSPPQAASRPTVPADAIMTSARRRSITLRS